MKDRIYTRFYCRNDFRRSFRYGLTLHRVSIEGIILWHTPSNLLRFAMRLQNEGDY